MENGSLASFLSRSQLLYRGDGSKKHDRLSMILIIWTGFGDLFKMDVVFLSILMNNK